MLENALLLLKIIVMGWVIFRTILAEVKGKRRSADSWYDEG